MTAPKTKTRPYEMVISRLTVDKLGVKLYDKASAVVAELVANGYDADAEKVTVRLPLGAQLASKTGKAGQPKDLGFIIEVEDDGHGMTPDEAIDCYLRVGRDRRESSAQGGKSRTKKRPVMGRKGIGKLAPFGICRTIEVRSAGGQRTEKGYLVSHFFMNFGEIVKDKDEPVPLKAGAEDRTYRPSSGTLVRLTTFLPKRVPPFDTFMRQLARRFFFAKQDFKILVQDTQEPTAEAVEVKSFDVPLLDGTKVDVSSRPVPTDDGKKLPVSGWLGLAKEAYKDEEMAGVRIYARNKIVATTRDFEQPAGFTGEFTTRSYLVGEIHAEWLDGDKDEDLIRTDRQGILWDSDLGSALRQWGADLIKEIGAASRKPRRERVRQMFLDASDFQKKAKKRYSDASVVKAAVSLAEQIGAFASEDELEDTSYVDELSDVILSVAPHKALIEAFQEFAKETSNNEAKLEQLVDLFGKTRVAELASYGQIASERVRIIGELERVLTKKSDEAALQRLITEGPWLIHPTWTVITINQKLKTFKTLFEAYWKNRTNSTVLLAIGHDTKRPDFTLVSVDGLLHIVEIKAAEHVFGDKDFERLHNYVDAFKAFYEQHDELKQEFHRGWQIDLIADGAKFADAIKKTAFDGLVREKVVVRSSWTDFLLRAKTAHEKFLEIHHAAKKRA